MSIFRKDRDKPETAAVPNTAVESEAEEYTDINAAASDSSSQSLDTMEEIYSTKDKQVKFKRLTPLEAEAAARRKQVTKADLIRGKLEFSSSADEVRPEVALEAELDPNAIVAEDIIEDVADVKKLRNIYVQDIDEIDISLDPMDNLREYERRANDKDRYDARRQAPDDNPYIARSGEKIVAKVPVYQHEDAVEKIYLKAGRFTDVVEAEYDEYLKSTDPTISKNYHAMQKAIKPRQSLLYTLSQMAEKRKEEQEQQHKIPDAMRNNFDEEPVQKPKKESGIRKFFRVLGAAIAGTFAAPARDAEEQNADYNSRQDEKYVLDKSRGSIRRLAWHTAAFAVLSILLLVPVIMERTAGEEALGAVTADGALLYCGVNLILTVLLGIPARRYIADGIRPLRRLKGNCYTMAALAYLACLLQSIISMFTARSFLGGGHHLYSFIAGFALLLNTVGRLLMEIRVKSNFSFITSHSPAYAAKIYNDEETARRMVSGTTASKGVVAYQHITRFLSDFLKISYAPDPSEEITGKLTPITVISALFVTVMYGILFKNVAGTVSALAVMLCVGTPFTALLAGNLPLLLFSRRMLREGAMVAGYPSVRQFCDTTAAMVSAAELFPRGCVKLSELIPYQEFRVEENLLMAAAVLTEAGSPIAPVFDELVAENAHVLPTVESVLYEDKSGLVGWIGGERVLIGNMALMNRYHITVPQTLSKKKGDGRAITYIACSGQAVAALILSYHASPIAKPQIQKAESSGLAFVVSTCDPNVTADLIADRYEIFYRSVKVMPPGYSNTIEEATSKVEETSRSYLATRGRCGAMVRAIGGCIGLKANISLGIVIEIFGLILGVLLCATLALYASVTRLSIVELMIYILFWVGATLIAELIRRP